MQRTSFLIVALLFLFSFDSTVYAQQSKEPAKIEVGVHFSSFTIEPQEPFQSLNLNLESTRSEAGFGGRLSYNLNRHVALEAEGNFFLRFATPQFDNGGRLVQGQFGVKAGKRFQKFGLFAKARPGFVSFSDVLTQTGTETIFFNGQPLVVPTFDVRRRNFFSLDVGGVLELYPSRRVLVRFDAGDTMVHVGEINVPPFGGLQPLKGMKHRFQFSSGIAFRFLNPEGDQETDLSPPDRNRKFEVGAQFSSLSLNVFSHIQLPQLGFSFNEAQSGFGGRLTYNFTRSVAAEVQADFYPADQTSFANGRAGGRMLQIQAGTKIGKRFEKFGVFGKLRPGAVSFSKTIEFDRFDANSTFNVSHIERSTYFSLDVGGVLEFYPTPRIVARFDGGDTMIHYGSTLVPFFSRNNPSIEVPANTTHQFQFSAGVGFRF